MTSSERHVQEDKGGRLPTIRSMFDESEIDIRRLFIYEAVVEESMLRYEEESGVLWHIEDRGELHLQQDVEEAARNVN